MLNHTQRNHIILDRRGLITYRSCFLFSIPELPRKTWVSQWRTTKGRSDGWWETALALFPLSSGIAIVPNKTILNQSSIYLFIQSFRSFHIPIRTVIFERHLIESMLYCSAYKLPTRRLAWIEVVLSVRGLLVNQKHISYIILIGEHFS